uniref:ribosomal protein L14 n=1 Tax=Sarcophyte sanguinea TaxID=1618143 RepID=UPI0026E488A4|nr:ribosomal protein L14 [Sarcophyte sanguinea]WJE89100.1 ribosomal protein L14 [Sarcophyte sanguinea]WJE89119.1 ribosomal protein L14 [Sarcophyte sanguinea]
MIQLQTYLNVADNSGVNKLMYIRNFGINKCKYAHIGNIVIVVIKEINSNISFEKSEIVKAVIVRTRKGLKRKNGIKIQYDDNAAIIIDQEKNPKGTRIFGPIVREFRYFNFIKIVSLASEIL